MRKSLMLLIILILVIPVPAYGVIQVQWNGAFGWANPVSGETTVWDTGFQTSGDWSLTEKWSFFLRDQVSIDSGTQVWEGVLERCYLRYETGAIRINFGRQAVNWGVGWFFRPTDLITPRNLLSKDESRPGRDLVALYWGTSPVTSFEAIYGPGAREGLAAIRNDWRIGATNFRVLVVANGRDEISGLQLKTIGCDFQGGLAGFYGEAVVQWTDEFSTGKPIMMLGWGQSLGAHHLFVEYLKDTSKRIYWSEEYLAAGWEIAIDELTSITLASVGNLQDGGIGFSGAAGFLLGDSMDLSATINYLMGPDGTEFMIKSGGARATVILQLKYYF